MRAPRRPSRWTLAALALVTLGSMPVAGCDALQTGAVDAVPARPGLRLTLRGDFSGLRAPDSRFGRIAIGAGAKVPTRTLSRADLAAVLLGQQSLEGVTLTESELTLRFTDLAPGDYSFTVVLYDQSGTKLSDNAFQKELEAGVLEVVSLDLTAALAGPAPSPGPSTGDLATRVELVGTGDGLAHPVELAGTLPAYFGMPATTGSRWVYEATQSLYVGDGIAVLGSTRSVDVLGPTAVRLDETVADGTTYTIGTFPALDQVSSSLRHFGTLGLDRLQATGATRSFAVGGATFEGRHFVLSAARFADEDPSPNWPVPVSTHTYDLWYAQGVGLLDSRDTVFLTDGSVVPGLHLRLRAFRPGQ